MIPFSEPPTHYSPICYLCRDSSPSARNNKCFKSNRRLSKPFRPPSVRFPPLREGNRKPARFPLLRRGNLTEGVHSVSHDSLETISQLRHLSSPNVKSSLSVLRRTLYRHRRGTPPLRALHLMFAACWQTGHARGRAPTVPRGERSCTSLYWVTISSLRLSSPSKIKSSPFRTVLPPSVRFPPLREGNRKPARFPLLRRGNLTEGGSLILHCC